MAGVLKEQQGQWCWSRVRQDQSWGVGRSRKASRVTVSTEVVAKLQGPPTSRPIKPWSGWCRRRADSELPTSCSFWAPLSRLWRPPWEPRPLQSRQVSHVLHNFWEPNLTEPSVSNRPQRLPPAGPSHEPAFSVTPQNTHLLSLSLETLGGTRGTESQAKAAAPPDRWCDPWNLQLLALLGQEAHFATASLAAKLLAEVLQDARPCHRMRQKLTSYFHSLLF